MGHLPHKPKVLIFIVAYNASKKICSVIDRIPENITSNFDVSLLIIDDCSSDSTYEIARDYLRNGFWCKSEVLKNPVNLGYGGNQKVGYFYAIQNQFDLVVLLHGDGQYAPEKISILLDPFNNSSPPDAVFGSRMKVKEDALKGGMPYYKYLGNQILTFMQNSFLGSNLTEFHSGYRVYSVNKLKQLPFELNTNDFHFDTEIIIQLLFSNARITEVAIPTFYGDEICHVDGIAYAMNVIRASVKAKLIGFGIFYDPKFVSSSQSIYVSKFTFTSTHSICFDSIAVDSTVLDLGCADGYLSEKLNSEKNCTVYSVDVAPIKEVAGCQYQSANLNNELPIVPWDNLDYVVLLDVIEHLDDPEKFMYELRLKLSNNPRVKIIASSGNVCFLFTRIMMLLGQFNYGPRGILDITHKRLFTVKSLRRLLTYSSYRILTQKSVPAPYPLAIGLNWLSKFMIKINVVLARLMPGLFAYQAFYIIQPLPCSSYLLDRARTIDSK